MKEIILLTAIFLMSIPVSGQTPDLEGTWIGKCVKNGQPMGFTLTLNNDGHFSMAYDLNPNELSLKGDWSFNTGSVSHELKFKGTDEELQAFVQTKKRRGKSIIVFRKGKKKIRFKNSKDWRAFFGWDEGTAVVVNHEEMY